MTCRISLGFEATLNPFMLAPLWKSDLRDLPMPARVARLRRADVRRILLEQVEADARNKDVIGGRRVVDLVHGKVDARMRASKRGHRRAGEPPQRRDERRESHRPRHLSRPRT